MVSSTGDVPQLTRCVTVVKLVSGSASGGGLLGKCALGALGFDEVCWNNPTLVTNLCVVVQALERTGTWQSSYRAAKDRSAQNEAGQCGRVHDG